MKGAKGGESAPARGIDRARFDALLLDLDGVVTRTAAVHAAAWKKLFDGFLRARTEREGGAFVPFDPERDYRAHVDGRPRIEGVEAFLESRAIRLPRGDPADGPEEETAWGLANRKNRLFREHLRQHGAETFESTVALVRHARAWGFRIAVVSSSRNCAAVLEAAGLGSLFETQVDGVELERLGLRGKPEPDMYLEAARRLDTPPARAVVFEDARAGVEAARRGGFGLVVGVDRAHQAAALSSRGADVVVMDLAEISIEAGGRPPGRPRNRIPSALESRDEIERRLGAKRPAVFLDYDGTLTPIVSRPELAVIPEETRAAVRALARLCPVAIVSGRARSDVQALVGLESLVYAGSHGFDIAGPGGASLRHEAGARYVELVERAERDLGDRLRGIGGALVEGKKYSVAVHYRLVEERDVRAVQAAVEAVVAAGPGLRLTTGKKVFELRPDVDWDKGRALRWLLEALGLGGPEVLPLYIGDDTTDEDAFAALLERGLGIVVEGGPRPTLADYALRDPGEVRVFLEAMTAWLEGRQG